MGTPDKISAETFLSEADRIPENCNCFAFETMKNNDINFSPPKLLKSQDKQRPQTTSIPQSFPVPHHFPVPREENKNFDTFSSTPCKKKKSTPIENDRIWRELENEENNNTSPLMSCRVSLFQQNGSDCGIATVVNHSNNLKMNDQKTISLTANVNQNDPSPSGKMRRCFLGSKRSWDEDLDMNRSINHIQEVDLYPGPIKNFRSGSMEHEIIAMNNLSSSSFEATLDNNIPNHSVSKNTTWHKIKGSENHSQPLQQTRQTDNVGTPSRSPESHQPKLMKRLFLPTLCANAEEPRDEFINEDIGNKPLRSNSLTKEESKERCEGFSDMLPSKSLGNDLNKGHSHDKRENNTHLDRTESNGIDTLNKSNHLHSPPKRRVFQLGPRSQSNKAKDDLNDVSARLFCPCPTTETTEKKIQAHGSSYNVTTGPIDYSIEPITTPRKSPISFLFPATEETPNTTPRSLPVQTPLSKMRTYQSPGWSQAVSINPFSPVPPKYLTSDRTISPRLSDSTISTPRSQKKQHNWSVSPSASKAPCYKLNSNSQKSKNRNSNDITFTISNRKFSPMDVTDFPPCTPSKQKNTRGQRNYSTHNTFDNSPENTNTTQLCPLPPARLLSFTNTRSQALSNSHTIESIPDMLSASSSRFENDFQTLSVLGNGSFGTVLKCISRLDGCLYAIKTTRRSIRGNLEKHKFLKEVHALSALCNQPEKGTFHIVRYHQAWIEDGHLYIQTELCDQGNLLQYMTINGGVQEAERWKILREILLALELVHQNEMVHLDIKPENIFIKNNHYKLGDFGLASTTTNDAGDIEEGDARYMPRELLDQGSARDLTKCDIFSLGATIYEICRGFLLPCDGKEWQDIRSSRFLPLQGTSFELEILITQLMMHPDPTLRLSASELLKKPQLLSEEEKFFFLEKEKLKEAHDALRFNKSRLSKDTRPQSNPSF